MGAVANIKPKANLAAKFSSRFGVDENEVMGILKATAFKQRDGQAPVSDAQMTALMIVADQYGLNPFVKEIYAYPDKQNGIVPVVGVDGWNRIMNEHPQMDGIEFRYSDETVQHKNKTCHVWIEAIITRKDRSKPVVVREYFDEVVRSVSFATPWDSHPKRMHRHKTEIQAARIAFGFAGIYDEDEAERIIEKDITPAGTVEEPQFYSSQDFEAKQHEWQGIVDSGRKSADSLIATVESRGKKFTEEQVKIIKGWDKKPDVIEGESEKVDDPFVTDMESEEKGDK